MIARDHPSFTWCPVFTWVHVQFHFELNRVHVATHTFTSSCVKSLLWSHVTNSAACDFRVWEVCIRGYSRMSKRSVIFHAWSNLLTTHHYLNIVTSPRCHVHKSQPISPLRQNVSSINFFLPLHSLCLNILGNRFTVYFSLFFALFYQTSME